MIHALPLIAYTIIVWLFGSFAAWDITWFLDIGEWAVFERVALFFAALIGCVPFVAIPCIIKEMKDD
jgi:hypothetical protein